ncbi:MAG: UvrD-helicase domain-containing protein [Patescibacteria group bacterium]|jgi:DNA helicase-2/ATP-dependent DNA helicase PcrA
MNSVLDNLNEPQQQAVKHLDGPVLILAGAGSGKTKVLTHRIAYLLLNHHVNPENILAVTFTNKAANEMKERVSKLLLENNFKGGQMLPWLGTFHAVCVKILRREADKIGYSPDYVIYDDSDQKQVLKRIIDELKLDPKTFQVSTVQYFISGAKNEMVSEEAYANFANGYYQEQISVIYKMYQHRMRQANAMDFDDLLTLTVEVFTKNPHILDKYQQLFRYILVDEYQDTNAVQYKLTKLLAEKHHNICVVGDDYQAIYSWRGANFRNILDFERDYPDAFVVKLEQNYRSTKIILDGANAVIAKNTNRTDKKLWTNKLGGRPITLYQALNEADEADFIAGEITSLRRSKQFPRFRDFAILYRTNAQSRAIEDVFVRNQIPYRVIGGLRFYERKEIKDAICYLRVVANKADRVSLGRVINTPTRGIGEKSVETILRETTDRVFDPNYDIPNLSGRTAESFKRFRQMILDGRKLYDQNGDLLELFNFLMEQSGYLSWLDSHTPEGLNRLENIDELKTVLKEEPDLTTFLANVSLVSDIDQYDANADSVALMTMHSAKGLEFPVVFIAGMEEGIFPHSRSSLDPSEIEEERRLCYVGMTRAKERLYLLYARERRLYGGIQANPVSRFIGDLPEELIEEL